MPITNVRIQLPPDDAPHILGLAAVVYDDDKIVEGVKIFRGHSKKLVVMPTYRPLHCCRHCGGLNVANVLFCNYCGKNPKEPGRGVPKFVEVFHPATPEAREEIERHVLDALDAELEMCKQPGYAPHLIPHIIVVCAVAEYRERFLR